MSWIQLSAYHSENGLFLVYGAGIRRIRRLKYANGQILPDGVAFTSRWQTTSSSMAEA